MSTDRTTNDLNSLIQRRAVRVVFQPIVDLNDGMIVAYEALCRPEKNGAFSGADVLFHAAEDCGKLWELEQLTRGLSMEAAANWPRDVRLFLNVSPTVFGDSRFVQTLCEDLVRATGLTSDRIVLEITELAETAFSDELLEQVQLARLNRFEVAIDDAGAGTSGLNRMMLVRPQWIKLDRQLISGIDQDPFKQNLVRFFVHFARMSGVSVIAEGIETPAELGSLLGLGVRFGQGYYLAMPGERSQTGDAQFVAQVRERWAAVDSAVPPEPMDLPMVRLAREVLVSDSSSSRIKAVADQLRSQPAHSGVVVTEGRRLVGWAGREHVLNLATGPSGNSPISVASQPCVCALTPESSVQEALQLLCTREDHDLSQPLVIASGPDVIGVVHVRDLLRAAASDGRHGSVLRTTLTGLPSRVRADQHLEMMIAMAADPALHASREFHADAAFVDVRRFADYNGVFGYEMGDRVIRELSNQINTIVGRSEPNVFVAHLGDDRFLITSNEGRLEARLRELMQKFEGLSPSLTDSGVVNIVSGATSMAGPSLGLRVLLMPKVFERVTHPREVYRLEQQLRQKARNQEATMEPGQSLLVTDCRGVAIEPARLAA